jgi:hypothetical protein
LRPENNVRNPLTLFEAVHPLLNLRQVSQCQLQVDDINVVQRIHLSSHVNNIIVLKAPHHL